MFEYDLCVLYVCFVYLMLYLYRNFDDFWLVYWLFRYGLFEYVIFIN